MKNTLLIDFENVQKISLEAIDPSTTSVYIFLGRNQSRLPVELVTGAQRLGSSLTWVQIAGEGKNNLDFHIAYELGRLSVLEPPGTEFVILSKDGGYDAMMRYAQSNGIQCRRIKSIAELGVKRRGGAQGASNGRSGGGRGTAQGTAGGRGAASGSSGGRPGAAASSGRGASTGAPGARGAASGGAGGRPGASMSAPARFSSSLTDEIISNLQKINPNKRPRTRDSLRKHLQSAFKGRIDPAELDEMLDRLFGEALLIEENRRIRYSL